MLYVGIDWADSNHQIFVTSDSAQELASFSITHDAEGFKRLLSKTRSLSQKRKDVLFAIETPNHPLVEYLLDRGYTICAINPKAVDRYRDRHHLSGAKSDPIDAKVLAHILRTDRENHRAILPHSELAKELKILVRDHRSLVETRARLSNQLTACLKTYYPAVLLMFKDIDRKCALAFLKRYPTLQKAKALSLAELRSFLQTLGYGHPQKIEKMHRLLSLPQIPVSASVTRARSKYVLALVSQLLPLLEEIKAYEEEIECLLKKHPDSKLFTSLPGAGVILAARVLTELGENRELHPHYSSLQCLAGTAPVTRSSGTYRVVKLRRSCKKEFRDAMQQLAFCSLLKSSWARHYYEGLRKKGKSHSQATRALANKWLKIIHALWQNKELYDEECHLAMQQNHKMQENRKVVLSVA